MPRLNVSWNSSIPKGASETIARTLDYARLSAVSYWPGNRFRQMDYMRATFEGLDIGMEEVLSPDQFLSFREGSKPYLNYLGGRRAISDSPGFGILGEEISLITERAAWVGLAFLQIYLVAKHSEDPGLASLNRMAFYLDSTKLRLKPTFMKTWKEFKSVAHLWAAHFMADYFYLIDLAAAVEEKTEVMEPTDVITDEDFLQKASCNRIEQTFAWAHEFQEFGTNFIPQRATSPVLDPVDTWIIEGTNPWARRPMPSLNPELLSILREYQAPKDLTTN